MASLPATSPRSECSLLNRAADPGFTLDLLQRELAPYAGTPIRITSCQPSILESQPEAPNGKSWVLYEVEFEAQSGQRWHKFLLGSFPVKRGLPESESSGELPARLRRAVIEPFQQPAVYIPQLQMWLFLHSVDTALPALLRLNGPDKMQLLAPLFPECRAGMRIERVHWSPIRYSPSRRCVIALTLTLLDPKSGPYQRTAFAKIFADDRGAGVYEDMLAVWEASQQSKYLNVPRPLSYAPEHRMLVMERAPGTPELSDWLWQLETTGDLPPGVDEDRLASSVIAAARALAELHRTNISTRRQQRLPERLAELRKKLRRIRQVPSELFQDVRRVLERVQAHSRDDEPLVPCHGAFRHTQLVGSDQYSIIDWDGLTLANPAIDAATFIRRLRRPSIMKAGGIERLETLAAIFRQEFLSTHPEISKHDIDIYEALAQTQSVFRLVLRATQRRGNQPSPLKQAHRLANEAHQLLDELDA